MNQSVVSIGMLHGKVVNALDLLLEVVEAIETKTIIQTVSQPEPPKKKGGKRGGRPPGSKNKTAEAPLGATGD